MNEDVTNFETIKANYSEIVTQLIKIRKENDLTQQFIADWLNVSRKKINEFENGRFDIELLCNYADRLSVTIDLKYAIE
jgi:DNA-binding XRE family transcriptional regulator